MNANAPLTKNEYRALAAEAYGPAAADNRGWVVALNALVGMAKGDLCWIHHRKTSSYYIGRIGGTWEYRSTPEYRAVDIVNVRPCFRLGPADPPDGVTFNFQAIRKAPERTVAPSVEIYNRLCGLGVD